MNALMRLGIAGHVKLYRSTGGRKGAMVQGMPVLLVTTTGRRSGQPRAVPLVYIRDGDHYVIAASAGGAPKHPAWFLNLRDQPAVRVQVGAEEWDAAAEITEGDDRAALWARLVQAGAFFAGYQEKTSRVIPMIRLRAAPAASAPGPSAEG